MFPRRRWLAACAALAGLGVAGAQECATASGVRALNFAAATGPGFSHTVPGGAAGDVLFAREPTAADVRREAFLARGAGERIAVSAEPDAQKQLPDLILERGQAHTVLWPLNGTCAIGSFEAAFALVATAGFFTRNAGAKTTAVLVPDTFNQESLQYTCDDSALGALPGTIYVAHTPTARVLTTASTPATAVELRAAHEAAVAYPEALVLRVEAGYAGAGGAGFAQRAGTAGAWAAQTQVRARLVAGSSQPTPSHGAHVALLLTRGELRADEDWAGLVCGTPPAGGGTHASYALCRAAGGAPSSAKVVDGVVVPLWRNDCCSLLQPRAEVASVSAEGRAAVATLGTGPGALWAHPTLTQTRRVCTPGADAETQQFPCRWPDALASPFPVADGTAGPYYFDRVLVPARGWLLVCVGTGAKFAHAIGLQVAPNAPSDPYVFAPGTHVFGDTGARGGCAHSCPAGDSYTNIRGELAWTPTVPVDEDAAQELWLYAMFMLGDSDPCQRHACDAAALDVSAAEYLNAVRQVHALALFPGTTLDLVAPKAGARRRLAAVSAAPARVPALRRLRALAAHTRLLQAHPLSAATRRHLLTVAGDTARAEGAVAAREVLGVDPVVMLEHGVCRATGGTDCHALRADVNLHSREHYCRPEAELLAELQPVFARAIPRYTVAITGVHRPQYATECLQSGHGRLLLQQKVVNFNGDVKLVVSSTGEIQNIYFLESVLEANGINSIQAEQGKTLRSTVRSCESGVDFTNQDCGMVPETKDTTWPGVIWVLIAVAAVVLSCVVAYVLVLRCRVSAPGPTTCPSESSRLLGQLPTAPQPGAYAQARHAIVPGGYMQQAPPVMMNAQLGYAQPGLNYASNF